MTIFSLFSWHTLKNEQQTMISGENFIAGERSAKGEKTFRTFNPALNQENSWLFHEATSQEVNSAVQSAADAFEAFNTLSDKTRAGLLRSIVQEMEGLGDNLLEVYCQESGLNKVRAKVERSRTLSQLLMFADFIESNNWRDANFEKAEPNRSNKPKPSLFKTYVPLGPVAVFGASNFPLAYSTAGGDTASALAAGCPVIVKSHPMHAGTGELVAGAICSAIRKLKLAGGIFSNLNSAGIEVGQELVQHEKIKAVGFTGSINGGRALFDLAAKRKEPIPVFAEMGSLNPVVFTEKGLEKQMSSWVKTYVKSITNGSGQFCTKPGLLIGVKSTIFSRFATELADELSKKETALMLHPSMKSNFLNKRQSVLKQADVSMLTEQGQNELNHGVHTIAKVSGAQFIKNNQLHTEVFGPFSLIIECADEGEVMRLIGQLEGQLTATLVADEAELENSLSLLKAMSKIAGRVIINGVPTGVEVTQSMTHGGPYPASTDSRFTAVGTDSIMRWLRPVTYQNFPESLLKELGLNSA